MGVCHEELGAAEFSGILGGNVYVNTTRDFFGPNLRWMPLIYILKPSVISSFVSSWKHGHASNANFQGEGRLLGGLYVMGAGDRGVVYQFEEPQPGVYAPKEDILRAAEAVQMK